MERTDKPADRPPAEDKKPKEAPVTTSTHRGQSPPKAKPQEPATWVGIVVTAGCEVDFGYE